ncbi:MAG: hypothetical protein H6865_00900 [Rhodospirillales bacterium]|nr:hypothetical protein [Alphaproteobacteria bacterium]MCB9986184.1 hypothetical protein [Rhodospirillales bacterium]USO07259.1 MAG: hypothetical protein H6866_07470 [Rhodospirillales bacterium]
MKRWQHTLMILGVVSGLASGLSACSPDKPWLMEKSTLNADKLRLVESRYIEKQPLGAMDAVKIAEAAQTYRKKGAGPLYLVVAYKDGGKTGDSTISARKAEIIKELLQSGVPDGDITASSVPLDAPVPVALIAFDTLEAQGPAACADMPIPGYDAPAEADNMLTYQTGCGVKGMMARQIENPADLEGHAGLGGRNDGGHLAAVVNTQLRPGTPRDFLPSYVLSELAAGK